MLGESPITLYILYIFVFQLKRENKYITLSFQVYNIFHHDLF